MILFVYGTLKRGQPNHWYLRGQRYLGDAVTQPRYRLVDLGPYPGLVVDDADGLAVAGELWDVDAAGLAAIDEFDGVPVLYSRRPVALQEVAESAGAYLFSEVVPAGVRSGDSWPMERMPYSPSTSAIV